MRDHCHTRAGLGVAAESFGEDDGVQSQRGGGGKKGQKEHVVADLEPKRGVCERFKAECERHDHRGQQGEPQRGRYVNLFVFQHRKEVVFRDRHSRKQHCHGSHADLERVERVCQKSGNVFADAAEPDNYTEKHRDRGCIDQTPPRAALLFRARRHNADAPGIDHQLDRQAVELVIGKRNLAKQRKHDGVAHISAVRERQGIVIDPALGAFFFDEIAGEKDRYSHGKQNAEG